MGALSSHDLDATSVHIYGSQVDVVMSVQQSFSVLYRDLPCIHRELFFPHDPPQDHDVMVDHAI